MMSQSVVDDEGSPRVVPDDHSSVASSRSSPSVTSSAPPRSSSSPVVVGYRLPVCEPPSSIELAAVRRHVARAVDDDDDDDEGPRSSAYRALLDAVLRGRRSGGGGVSEESGGGGVSEDTTTFRLYQTLLALRGGALARLASRPRRHARLVHALLRLDAFAPPKRRRRDEKSVVVGHPDDDDDDDDDDRAYYDDHRVADAWLRVTVGLVSANPTYAVPCMDVLWRRLTTFTPTEATEERISRLHAGLATILRSVPRAVDELLGLLKRRAPYRRADGQDRYAAQCLRTLEYAPSLEEGVVSLLVDRCLAMDVEITVDAEGRATLEKEEFTSSGGEENKQSEEEEKPGVNQMAARLDAVMTVLFRHIDSHTDHPALFRMFLRIFDASVLTTHRSKYVQFLLFYLCRFGTHDDDDDDDDERHFDRSFCAHLLQRVFSTDAPSETRRSAACYLASFVSRASFVSADTACESAAALLRWASAYAERHRDDDDDDRDLFHAVRQAAFYVFCFRGDEALEARRARPDDPSLEVDAARWNLVASASSLAHCLESVRREFLLFARSRGLLDEATIERAEVERATTTTTTTTNSASTVETTPTKQRPRKRRRRGSSISTPATRERRRLEEIRRTREGNDDDGRRGGGVGGLGAGSNPLDSFFPFDPCLLERSHAFVEPYYRRWEGGVVVATTTDSEGEDDEDEDEVSDDDRSTIEAVVSDYTEIEEEEEKDRCDDGDRNEDEDDGNDSPSQGQFENPRKRPRTWSTGSAASW